MKTFTIKEKHLDEHNYYVGKQDLYNFDGNIIAAKDLGAIYFRNNISCSGDILFSNGSGITTIHSIFCAGDLCVGYNVKTGSCINTKGSIYIHGTLVAGESIVSDSYIKVKENIQSAWGINANGDITAGYGIDARHRIEALNGSIIASHSITSGENIIAAKNIKAGTGIFTRWGLTAGNTISTSGGINAGLGIKCKILDVDGVIITGSTPWLRNLSNDKYDAYIEYDELKNGEIRNC